MLVQGELVHMAYDVFKLKPAREERSEVRGLQLMAKEGFG
jgi:hypothetical protein